MNDNCPDRRSCTCAAAAGVLAEARPLALPSQLPLLLPLMEADSVEVLEMTRLQEKAPLMGTARIPGAAAPSPG